MKKLVSVIVPIYKVEDYLARCLDSLSRQSLKHIEIILVDDASPDRCGQICEEYAVKDERFKVIRHSKNKGLSAARNTGIFNASSDYLMFVDSDDYVHEDFCKDAYECAVTYHADMVMFRYHQFNEAGKNEKLPYPDYAQGSGFKTKIEAINMILQKVVWDTAWNKLYRKELFQNISYPYGYLYEDTGTTHKLIWQANGIYYLDKVLYYHCYREGSIMTLKTKKAVQDRLAMHLVRLQDLRKWGFPPKELELKFYELALWYCVKRKTDNSDPKYVYCANVLRCCKLNTFGLSWKKIVMLLLFKFCPPFFELVCEMKGMKVG